MRGVDTTRNVVSWSQICNFVFMQHEAQPAQPQGQSRNVEAAVSAMLEAANKTATSKLGGTDF